mgnify:CR=1 FL=1
MSNGLYAKILAGVLVILLTSATIGGFNLTAQVAAMGSEINALREDFKEFKTRLIYVERAVRDGSL